jgi:hypothetical protein
MSDINLLLWVMLLLVGSIVWLILSAFNAIEQRAVRRLARLARPDAACPLERRIRPAVPASPLPPPQLSAGWAFFPIGDRRDDAPAFLPEFSLPRAAHAADRNGQKKAAVADCPHCA